MKSDSALKRSLGSTGLFTHPLGFGCYRIADGNAEHEAALRDYIERGGNLIDTSANYTDGQSEVLVGKVLQSYSRDRAIVVTKAGYIQGQNMTLAQSRSFPEVVKYGEGIWHCIHPDFLETQIALSTERLQLETIDIFLLHNPEYFLSHQAHQKRLDAEDHKEFYRRIGQAFQFLEHKVRQGKIRWYGTSSNNYGLAASDPAMTSVARCLAEAEGISPAHHFRVIQLPMNLYESGGAIELNNQGQTVLDFCRARGLGVLINRPLNAFFDNQMIRLADFAKPGSRTPQIEELSTLLSPLRKHEELLLEEIQVSPIGGREKLVKILEQIVPQLKSVDHWEQVVSHYVIVPLQRWIEDNSKKLGNNVSWGVWLEQFFPILHETFEEIERFVQAQQQSVSDQVRHKLRQAGMTDDSPTLSQIALSVLLNLDGVSCVLNGMRRRTYVQDALESILLPPIDALHLLKNFRNQLS